MNPNTSVIQTYVKRLFDWIEILKKKQTLAIYCLRNNLKEYNQESWADRWAKTNTSSLIQQTHHTSQRDISKESQFYWRDRKEEFKITS